MIRWCGWLIRHTSFYDEMFERGLVSFLAKPKLQFLGSNNGVGFGGNLKRDSNYEQLEVRVGLPVHNYFLRKGAEKSCDPILLHCSKARLYYYDASSSPFFWSPWVLLDFID